MRRLLSLTALILLGSAGPASATWYGSTMRGSANATYGCRQAVTLGPVGGVQLSPTHQTSCTYKHSGYQFRNRITSVVPSSGRITRIRVKSGKHPAKLRLVVLTGSSRVDTRTGQDIPGTYTCCTARYVGRAFRPRANRTTVKRVNVRVYVVRSVRLRIRIHSSDIVALTALGSGALPLHVRRDVGNFNSGSPLLTGFWPATRRGDPRVDGYTMPGIDLLFGWDFHRRR